MKTTDIIVQLERVRVKCGQAPETVTLELNEEWKWQDLEDACREACDILFDYDRAAAQAARLSAKYEVPKGAVRRRNGPVDLWQCPDCHNFIGYGNEHCHWCGRRLGWDACTGTSGKDGRGRRRTRRHTKAEEKTKAGKGRTE